MSTHRPILRALLAAIAVGLALPAAADPPHRGGGGPPPFAGDGPPPFARDHPGRGWGAGGVPPGHAKRYGRGDRLPDGYIVIRDPDRWRLPPPPRDEVYVRIDGQIVRILRDTATVVEAVGIVTDWLN